MDFFGKIGTVHPVVAVAWAVLLIVDGILIYQAVDHIRSYLFSKNWPRVQVAADHVDIQRVVYQGPTSPGTQEYYEAIIDFRYSVDGREYLKQVEETVSSREDAERLKESGRISFLYNPDNPAETIDAPSGALPALLVLAGLALVNAFGVALIRQLAQFVSGEP